MSILAALASAALLSGSIQVEQPRQQPTSDAAATELDSIIVEGRRIEEAARAFIEQVGEPPRGTRLARWNRPVCVSVTLFDAFVMARSAFNHSVNYRSVMLFGRAEVVADGAAKARHLETFVESLWPGRWQELRPMTAKEVKATSVVSMPILEGAAFGHAADKRARKLLLHAKEIEELDRAIQREGMTAIATQLYFKDGRAKVEIALARGKTRADKRESIKEKDAEREAKVAISRGRKGF